MIVLYTTGCPRCRVIEAKLRTKNITYTEVTDEDQILAKGISSVPYLEVDGALMDFSKANEWINSQEESL